MAIINCKPTVLIGDTKYLKDFKGGVYKAVSIDTVSQTHNYIERNVILFKLKQDNTWEEIGTFGCLENVAIYFDMKEKDLLSEGYIIDNYYRVWDVE